MDGRPYCCLYKLFLRDSNKVVEVRSYNADEMLVVLLMCHGLSDIVDGYHDMFHAASRIESLH
jgi:hypothetical protein